MVLILKLHFTNEECPSDLSTSVDDYNLFTITIIYTYNTIQVIDDYNTDTIQLYY